ncbi:transposase-like protein [Variovorax boronicumulans]|uniref:Transposase-like protein n=1 Tax=Variovorax boronicumulans TaxID=436515 RepID=A0AAW8CRJ0_9BURK|nr:hypothetical protein [Variovorax boronicumulans]MDP9891542.1 transposase-like protein [Variovorax boronicumulans]MDQ0051610.1 transposase-like protein [Variovorax boronicumulans]
MTNTDLLSYVGAITGVIGAVTGISGAIMGYLSYRKAGAIKSLELRLELMKIGVEVFQKADDLGALLARAKRSRDAVAAATGMYKSGAREKWIQQFAADEESLTAINESVDALNIDYSQSTLQQLEKAIGELHAFRVVVNGISARYTASISEDDRSREVLRDQTRARVNS